MKNRFRMGLAVAFLAMAGVCLVTTGCDRGKPNNSEQSAQTTVTVGYLPVSTTLPNWLAKSEGLAAKSSLEIEFKRYANSNLLLMALLNGEIQATSVCADEPILAAASKEKEGFEIYLQEVLTEDRAFDAIITKKDSSIQTLADLEGKTVACFPGSQLKAYLKIILRKEGVKPDAVKIVQLPPPNMLPSLQGGTIDACFALEPLITIGETKGLTRVVAASPIAKYIGEGKPICAASYLISSKWADEQPKAADAFVRSVYMALDLIESDYAKAAELYPEFTPIPAEIAPQIVITRFATINNPDIAGLEKEVAVLREAGVISEALDVQELLFHWRRKTY